MQFYIISNFIYKFQRKKSLNNRNINKIINLSYK